MEQWACAVTGRGRKLFLRPSARDFVEIADGGGRSVGMVPDPGGNGDEVGTRVDERMAIFYRNTADGDGRDGHQFRPPSKKLGLGPGGRFLGR